MSSIYRIYFFKDNIYYEYNEYLNTLVKAEKFSLSLFNINCSKNNSTISQITTKLKDVLNLIKSI